MTKLVCSDCRHENEPERIYCHNCGSRLERNATTKEDAPHEETAEGTQARLKQMFDPRRGRFLGIGSKIGQVLLGGLCFAVVLQMIFPPDLPPDKKSDTLAPMIGMDLLSAIESHNPPRLVYTEEGVNAYLASLVRRNNSPAKEGFFPIRRIFVQFDEGVCRIHVAYSVFGQTLYASSFYHVTVDQGKIVASCQGGFFGRLPIHPLLLGRLDFLFQKTWATVERERKQIAKLAGIEFHPQSVTLIIVR